MPNVLDQRGDRPAQKAHPLPREEDQEEKARLIAQILELQNTLEGMRLVLTLHYRYFRSQPTRGERTRRKHEATLGEPGARALHPKPRRVEPDLSAHSSKAVIKVNYSCATLFPR